MINIKEYKSGSLAVSVKSGTKIKKKIYKPKNLRQINNK
jgi:hypothetical protein